MGINKIVLHEENKPPLTIENVGDKFHGYITIHFSHGVPRKVESNEVKDVKIEVKM